MTYYSEEYIKKLTDAVDKCSPELPRLLMRFINKGEYIGIPGLPDEIFNNIERLTYQFRNKCKCCSK